MLIEHTLSTARRSSTSSSTRHEKAPGTLLWICSLAFGCSDPTTSLPRETRTHSAALSASTLDFVVTTLEIDQPDQPLRSGFDLDGHQSTSVTDCHVTDYLSSVSNELNRYGCDSYDPQCEGAIDNMLPELTELFTQTTAVPVRRRIRESLSAGRSLWLIRITGFDNQIEDSQVEVHIFHAFADQTKCSDSFGGSGTFWVDNAPLMSPGSITKPLWVLHGSVHQGHLVATHTPSFRWSTDGYIPLSTMLSQSQTFTFQLHETSLFASVSGLDTGMSLDATLGGWVNTDLFSLALEQTFPSVASQIFMMMPRLSDLPRPSDGQCDTGSPLAIGGISFGARSTLRPAVILGTRDTPVSGACGTVW